MKKRKVKDSAAIFIFGAFCYSTIIAMILVNYYR